MVRMLIADRFNDLFRVQHINDLFTGVGPVFAFHIFVILHFIQIIRVQFVDVSLEDLNRYSF